MVVKAVHCAQAMPQSQHSVLERIGRLFQRPSVWSRGSAAPATLVEAAPGASAASDRVAAMIAAHEAGVAGTDVRPRGNPAFAEAVFVELMRASQYRRAFEHLTAECRHSWGSPEAFAAAQGTGSMSRLRGMRVTDVRYLPTWTDATRGTTHEEVAELDVEYTLGERQPVVVPRVVHLVADGGKWRSLCYPAHQGRSGSPLASHPRALSAPGS